MNNLFKAALLPALTMLAGQVRSSLATTQGAYVGLDLNGGAPFAGLQGRLDPAETAVQLVPSIEGALRSGTDRWQFNADVLYPFSASRAPLAPYAGAGLCVVGASGENQRSFGFNLIGGANFELGPLSAFAQVRLTVADGVHLSLTGGAVPAFE